MRAEHLRMWHRKAKQEENLDPGNLEKVVAIIKVAFRGGELMASCAWKMVVIIPEGRGIHFRGIGLAKVLWNAISVIINLRLSSSIQFHDTLHGFCAGRGTGTATLKSNLLQSIISMKEAVLCSIFLDLCKAYNAMYRYQCLDILVGYEVRTRTLRILQTY